MLRVFIVLLVLVLPAACGVKGDLKHPHEVQKKTGE